MSQLFVFKTQTKLRFMKGMMAVVRKGRSMVGLPSQFVSKRRGINYSLDLNEAIDGCLYLIHDYEPELTRAFERLIRPGNVVLDIGANVGAHTLTMARLVGEEGRVYAFEPSSFGLNKLSENLKLNPYLSSRVSVEPVFLSDGVEPMPAAVSSSWDIARAIDSPERNRLDGGFASPLKDARCMTLDAWSAKVTPLRIDAIKLDVDGGEIAVLRGAVSTFKKYRPILFIELSPIHFIGHRYRFADQVQAVLDLGYRLYTLDGEDLPHDPSVLEAMIPFGALINVLGVPA